MAIRWTKSDYIKLGKAVSSFNKNVRKAEQIDYTVAPEIVEYTELKTKINTRAELKKAINSLKRYDAENLYKNEIVDIPKWNITSVSVAQIQAEKKIQKEIIKGDVDNKEALKIELDRIRNLQKLQGYERKRKEQRIMQVADVRYELRRAQTFRSNYIETIRNVYKGMEGYKELMKKLRDIKNPLEFYNTIKNNAVSVNDIDIYYQSNQRVTQEHLNNLLESWGVKTKDIQSVNE